ncbi:cytochrome P450 [Halovivax gelatinilyticus]|uniref:cytochrome P450 n=1 Tax=Halovivax gelatinilyticus TaxID=2961597 RepID=UPI0020CA5937|nr:cytochrome P450 [Halovivax gelatinilyticus]
MSQPPRSATGSEEPAADEPLDEEASTNEPRHPPGPRGIPVFGSTLSVVRDPLSFAESARAYGDVVGYRAFGREFVAVFDPELVESVLVSRSDEFGKGGFEADFGEAVAPDGVAFTSGDQWARQRRFFQGSFTPARIDAYTNEMVSETLATVESWGDGDVIDLREATSTLTLDVLTQTLFDLEFDGERAETVSRAARTMNDFVEADVLALRSLLPSAIRTPTERRFDRAMDALTDLVDELVAERRRDAGSGTTDRDDLLSILATAEYPDGSRMTADEIRDQLVTFLFAGRETTALALTYALWLVADDSAVRTRLDDELDAVCGSRDPRAADRSALVVTEAVAREAMRLYPPVADLYREPYEPTTLGGYRVTPETTLQLFVYGIHRDERWWDDPDAFRPDRWLDADGQLATSADDRPEYAYFPFGGGPRHCLGMRFAMAELVLVLATILRRVEFERVTESIDPTFRVTLDPGEVRMRVRKR